jgi:2-polyprenyl-6-methoxyphenol hydroxylase-like FAD-dependent oxidoreductase
VIQNDIFDISPLKTWTAGRVTLLGDAAHAMQPNLGQGACQAIEDAVVLAKCLRERPELTAALGAYERRRLAHANRAIIDSDRFGRVGQWENPLLCWMRDLLVRWTPGKLALGPMIRFARHDC